jgi:hypothetical protein
LAPGLGEGLCGQRAGLENLLFICRSFAAVDGSAGEVDDGEGVVESGGPIAGSGFGIPVDVLRCGGCGGLVGAAGEDDGDEIILQEK